uniref:Uncharacterized protein n=1 Tax=Aegilops tauschii subsp. strangulata TaxID=200361 RepID=A0A453SDQ3_AEGTS
MVNYEVFDLVLEHNHMLQLQETCHLMPSQLKITEIQAFEIEIADDSGIGPKAAHESACRRVGGSSILGYIQRDHKNYLRTKRQRELKYGEAGSILKYFQDKIRENPSFQYEIQHDCEEQITNIFWADARMIIDYAHFGDVVTFDTTFGTNKEHRPFGVFVGFNHFRETVIFLVLVFCTMKHLNLLDGFLKLFCQYTIRSSPRPYIPIKTLQWEMQWRVCFQQ